MKFQRETGTRLNYTYFLWPSAPFTQPSVGTSVRFTFTSHKDVTVWALTLAYKHSTCWRGVDYTRRLTDQPNLYSISYASGSLRRPHPHLQVTRHIGRTIEL